jgi:hypothetical protein
MIIIEKNGTVICQRKNKMDNSIINTLIKILVTINYQGDKDKFAKQFLYLCNRQAVLALAQNLPENEQQQLVDLLNKNDYVTYQSQITQKISKKDYDKAFFEAVSDQFSSFLLDVGSTLSEEQISEIEQIITPHN